MGRPRLTVGSYGTIGHLQLPDGTWRARAKFRDYDGEVRPVARYGKTRAAAERALKVALVDRQKTAAAGITAEMRVSDLGAEWLDRLDSQGQLAVQTRQLYRRVFTANIEKALGGYRVGELDAGACDRALQTIQDRAGHSVAKSSRAVLSGMLGLAVRRKALPTNPVRDTEPLHGTKTSSRALEPAEVEEITDALRTHQRALELDIPDLVDFILGTGCRTGEALAARAENIDLDAGTWEINATVIRIRGEGLVIQEHPKSKAGHRVLALPPYVIAMLRRRETEERLRAPQGVIFPSPSAKTLRDPSNCAGDLREVLNDLGQPDWITFRTFRKTVATMFDRGGKTPRQAADQLGHSKVSMTTDVYFGRKVAVADAAVLLER